MMIQYELSAGIAILVWALLILGPGFVGGSIWYGKGGPYWLGFFVGLLLNIIGLFWVSFAWPGQPCRFCLQKNPETARVCRACTRDLYPGATG
jgi:hypothetical protein